MALRRDSKYRTKQSKNCPFAIAIAIAVAFGFFAGAATILYIGNDPNGLLAWIKTRTQPISQPQVVTPPPGVRYVEIPSQVQHEPDPWNHETQGRQIAFNEANYQPKPIANTMQPPSQRHFEKRPAKPQASRVINYGPWKWESYKSGGGKSIVGGQFQYITQAGRIDTASVCQNEKFGSLRYRDCRKGAKKYFANECKKGNRVACSGENMIP